MVKVIKQKLSLISFRHKKFTHDSGGSLNILQKKITTYQTHRRLVIISRLPS